MGKAKKDEYNEETLSGLLTGALESILPERKERDKTPEELREEELKYELRKSALGKTAGWGDYKFDWEDERDKKLNLPVKPRKYKD